MGIEQEVICSASRDQGTRVGYGAGFTGCSSEIDANPSTKAWTSVVGLAAELEQFTVLIEKPDNDVARRTVAGPRIRPVAQVGTLRFPLIRPAAFPLTVSKACRCAWTHAAKYLPP